MHTCSCPLFFCGTIIKMRNFLSIAVVILLLPGLVFAGGGGGLTSIAKIAIVVAAAIVTSGAAAGFFSAGEALTAAQMFVVGTGAAVGVGYVQCAGGQDNVSFEGCGRGSGSGSGGSGANTSQTTPAANVADGKVGSCSLGNKLCGTNSCIPSEAVCCQNVGLNGYCPAGNVCTKDGTCEVATADNTTCSNLQGTKCISPANSCGQTNASSYKCDGSCTVFAAPDSGCATPDITLTVPSFVEYGKECLITSKVNNATSCSIDGTNVTVPNGTYKTPPIVATANFTMVCQNGSVVTASKTVTCRINPTFEEF